jgi:Cu-Zn family superoxide dismutase
MTAIRSLWVTPRRDTRKAWYVFILCFSSFVFFSPSPVFFPSSLYYYYFGGLAILMSCAYLCVCVLARAEVTLRAQIGIGNTTSGGLAGAANQAGQGASVTVLGARLNGTSACPLCTGFVWLVANGSNGQVEIVAWLEPGPELEEGAHGFHIHVSGDLSEAGGGSAGGHYNPQNATHNLPPVEPRHQGDLGMISARDSSGRYWYHLVDTYPSSLASVAGRAVVVHATLDHGAGYGCDQAGNAGPRMAWGVLGLLDPAAPSAQPPVPPISISNDWASQDCAPRPPPDDSPGGRSLIAAIIALAVVDTLLLVALVGTALYFRRRLQHMQAVE